MVYDLPLMNWPQFLKELQTDKKITSVFILGLKSWLSKFDSNFLHNFQGYREKDETISFYICFNIKLDEKTSFLSGSNIKNLFNFEVSRVRSSWVFSIPSFASRSVFFPSIDVICGR